MADRGTGKKLLLGDSFRAWRSCYFRDRPASLDARKSGAASPARPAHRTTCAKRPLVGNSGDGPLRAGRGRGQSSIFARERKRKRVLQKHNIAGLLVQE